MNIKQSAYLKKLYKQYNEVIKPLIALYEAREEKFLTPVLNEIRAYNDHIARCYLPDANSKFIDSQLRSAERHIKRIILDCYKYLNVSFNDEVKKFEKRTKNVDLSIINNGDFYIKFKQYRNNTISLIREAKALESQSNDDDKIFKSFEKAFNEYSKLSILINTNFVQINWAKAKSIIKKYFWIIAAIISGIISFILSSLFE